MYSKKFIMLMDIYFIGAMRESDKFNIAKINSLKYNFSKTFQMYSNIFISGFPTAMLIQYVNICSHM